MKTAVSIPDDVYRTAEKLAARLGKSRSQVYAQALSGYLAKHQKDGVTEKLDEVYDGEATGVDKTLANLQLRSLPKEGW